MLAAGPHTFLRRHGPRDGAFFGTGEHILELNHPRIREQQGWIIARHQRRRRHHLMVALPEIFEEKLANFFQAAHGFS